MGDGAELAQHVDDGSPRGGAFLVPVKRAAARRAGKDAGDGGSCLIFVGNDDRCADDVGNATGQLG